MVKIILSLLFFISVSPLVAGPVYVFKIKYKDTKSHKVEKKGEQERWAGDEAEHAEIVVANNISDAIDCVSIKDTNRKLISAHKEATIIDLCSLDNFGDMFLYEIKTQHTEVKAGVVSVKFENTKHVAKSMLSAIACMSSVFPTKIITEVKEIMTINSDCTKKSPSE